MRIQTFLYVALLSPVALRAGERSSMLTLYDFASPSTSGLWRSVNDDVMGGVSRGGFRVRTESMRLEFSGELSLENRGGFASVRSSGQNHDLTDFVGVALRIRGDGRRYFVNLRTNHTPLGGSYRADLPTENGEWVTVRLPFKSFRATFHGRLLRDAPPLNRRQVRSIGVTLADKREGPFKLEIDWIKAY